MGKPSTDLQGPLDEAFGVFEAFEEVETSPPPEPDPEPETVEEEPPPPRTSRHASALPFVVGILLMLIGLFLGAAPQLELLPATAAARLGALGATSVSFFLAGMLLTILAWAQVTMGQRHTEQLGGIVEHHVSAVRAEVADMSLPAALPGPSTSTQDNEELRSRLAKLEGMVASVTKAVRMHSKPLVDLVGMVTDLGKTLQESERSLLAVKLDLEAIEKAVCETIATGEKKWEGMFERLHGSEERLEQSVTKGHEATLEHLDQSLTKSHDAMLERLAPRITDETRRLGSEIEAQWDLLRESLEQSIKDLETHTRDELQALGRRFDSHGERSGVDPAALNAIQQSVQRVLGSIEGLEVQTREELKALGRRLESGGEASEAAALNAIQQSLQRVLSSIEGLEHRGHTATTAPAPSRAPMPATAAPGSAPTASGGPPPTGKVLSAIERLKQMRGS